MGDAASSMSAPGADEVAMLWRNAPLHLISLEPASLKFHRGLLWSHDKQGHSPTATSTIFDSPLPCPSSDEFQPEILSTISSFPHLFKIVTPINVQRFELLLQSHPNRPFVNSVLAGLQEGFWPFANSRPHSYPLTHDASFRPPKTAEQRQFLVDQCQTELAVERFSPSFGTKLLPGMYSMPVHSVPKPGTDKLRLVVDHSASTYSLNSMISRDDIAGSKLDTIKDLVDSLIHFRREHGPLVKLVLFKSDVSAAYRRLPMHPLWQIKQIVTVEGLRYVDRCNNFGNCASQHLWIGFMALVIWIAIFVRQLDHLKVYTDDAYSFEIATNFEEYRPYSCSFPRKQAQLLYLWDELGVPHAQAKQVWGDTLTIIGLLVDPNAMTVTMPPAKLQELLMAIQSFCHAPDGARQHSLRHFMQLAGWINWALNAFPLLKPSLSGLFDKIRGKDKPNAMIYVNQTICFELDWFSDHVQASDGIHVMQSLAWRPAEANFVFFCDASLEGLGCYLPAANVGFVAAAPASAPKNNIFFLEALCVCWAIHIAHRRQLSGNIVIFTDNENTVAMFNRLYSTVPVYNPILISAVDVLIQKPFRIQVLTVPGSENTVADALSRAHLAILHERFPKICLDFDTALPALPTPSRDMLGAAQC